MPNSTLTLFGAENVRSKPGTRAVSTRPSGSPVAGCSPASTRSQLARRRPSPRSPSAAAPAPTQSPVGLGPAEVVVLDARAHGRGARDRAVRLLEVVARPGRRRAFRSTARLLLGQTEPPLPQSDVRTVPNRVDRLCVAPRSAAGLSTCPLIPWAASSADARAPSQRSPPTLAPCGSDASSTRTARGRGNSWDARACRMRRERRSRRLGNRLAAEAIARLLDVFGQAPRAQGGGTATPEVKRWWAKTCDQVDPRIRRGIRLLDNDRVEPESTAARASCWWRCTRATPARCSLRQGSRVRPCRRRPRAIGAS